MGRTVDPKQAAIKLAEKTLAQREHAVKVAEAGAQAARNWLAHLRAESGKSEA